MYEPTALYNFLPFLACTDLLLQLASNCKKEFQNHFLELVYKSYVESTFKINILRRIESFNKTSSTNFILKLLYFSNIVNALSRRLPGIFSGDVEISNKVVLNKFKQVSSALLCMH